MQECPCGECSDSEEMIITKEEREGVQQQALEGQVQTATDQLIKYGRGQRGAGKRKFTATAEAKEAATKATEARCRERAEGAESLTVSDNRKRQKLRDERKTMPLDEAKTIIRELGLESDWVEWQKKAERGLLVGFVNNKLTGWYSDKPAIVYGIWARPGDKYHVAHMACYFTKKEDAEALVKRRPSSTDSDDHVTWYYSVVEKPWGQLTASERQNINEVPRGFPYRGD